MRRKHYAQRVAFSVRHLDQLLSSDCYVGRGREKRVLVAVADRALLERLANVSTMHVAMARCDACGHIAPLSLDACPRCGEPNEDDVLALARSTARKGAP